MSASAADAIRAAIEKEARVLDLEEEAIHEKRQMLQRLLDVLDEQEEAMPVAA